MGEFIADDAAAIAKRLNEIIQTESACPECANAGWTYHDYGTEWRLCSRCGNPAGKSEPDMPTACFGVLLGMREYELPVEISDVIRRLKELQIEDEDLVAEWTGVRNLR